MFTPKAFSQKSRISGFTPGSKQRQPSTSYSQSKRSSISTRNANASILDEAAQHRLETLGGPLPVQVTEVLAYSDKNVSPSVHLDPSGWAVLVAGNRLLVWRYKISGFSKLSQSSELSLPPSVHKCTSFLVTLLPGTRAEAPPRCVAVSPDGVIRCWANVMQPGVYSEAAIELKEQACSKLIQVEYEDGEVQCIVATNTSALYLITPVSGQQKQVSWRQFRTPAGMLSGISRRMSSFIFGSVSNQAIGAPLKSLIPGELMEDNFAAFFLLSGANLQKWCISDENEKMLYQQNIEKLVGDGISQEVWHTDSARLQNLKIWLMDIQSAGDAVIVLGAALNPDVSNEVYYGIGTLHTEGCDPPQSFLSFTVPQFTNPIVGEEELPMMKLILPDAANSTVYLYDDRSVSCSSTTDSKLPLDKVDFHTPGDRLLGAGCCDKCAVFFSSVHGLVTIKDVTQAPETSMHEQSTMFEPSVAEEEPSFSVPTSQLEEMSMCEDKIQRLKAAFLHSCRGHVTEAQNIVDGLFPKEMKSLAQVDGELDRLVSNLSQEMVDDIPVKDPRWAEAATKEATGSTVSLILIHQLDGKLKAHEYFLKFLKTVGLWDRLGAVRVRDTPLVTRMLLCEHAEKVVAAKGFREMHSQHPEIVDAAVKSVLKARGQAKLPPNLTAHDVFYREVSKLEEVLEQLQEFQMEYISSNKSSREIYHMVSTVNNLIHNTLFEAYQYRITKSVMYEPSVPKPEPELLPWTSSLGPRGLREILAKQHDVTLSQGVGEAQDREERDTLFQQVMEMTDMILDGYKTQLESIKQLEGESEQYLYVTKDYQQRRTGLLMTFMEHAEYERAASLAEKYCDFGVLVRLCEQTENQERLQRYMNQFQNMGFSDFVFRWYVEEGKRGKLMGSSLAAHPQLSHFLDGGDNKFMSWLHDINANDFYKAHSTLLQLAEQEQQYLSKKKTLLSLSKLAALATDDRPEENIMAINTKQDLILHQEQLPEEVIEGLGLAGDTMKVLTPKELVELYVSDYNNSANEYDFKKALDLLHYLDKTDPSLDYEGLLLHIWCRAILRDDWNLLGTENPVENSKETVFFKTIQMAHADQDINLKEYLPSVDVLLGSTELQHLQANQNFQYLIRAGFEQLGRILT